MVWNNPAERKRHYDKYRERDREINRTRKSCWRLRYKIKFTRDRERALRAARLAGYATIREAINGWKIIPANLHSDRGFPV
jgi:hypothetical protein